MLKYLITAISLLLYNNVIAQTDTLRVMTYNVLYYGDTPPCQGSHEASHRYLKTIISYTRPDVLGLVKMASVPFSPDDKFSTAPAGFPDSVLQFALNAAIPGRYAYCPYSNDAHANNVEILFYNQHKLGFVSVVSSYANITDFNTYKLYYKDPNLSRTHDTTFLYVTLNHDKSGDDFVAVRRMQIKGEMEHIEKHFSSLPNMINMGDFNLRGSQEPCYQTLVFPKDTAFRFYDPPFYPDNNLTYPADWDNNRAQYAAYLTTSTRKDETNCGTGGGAKNWYDHIFISPWIVNNTNYIQYIPHTYRVIGNDGHRYKIAINDNNNINTSAPPEVIDALYHMSNKYPVMIELAVSPNTSGKSIADTEIPAETKAIEGISIDSSVGDEMSLHFTKGMMNETVTVECFDANNASVFKKEIKVKDKDMQVKCKLAAGTYRVQFSTMHSVISQASFAKQ